MITTNMTKEEREHDKNYKMATNELQFFVDMLGITLTDKNRESIAQYSMYVINTTKFEAIRRLQTLGDKLK